MKMNGQAIQIIMYAIRKSNTVNDKTTNLMKDCQEQKKNSSKKCRKLKTVPYKIDKVLRQLLTVKLTAKK